MDAEKQRVTVPMRNAISSTNEQMHTSKHVNIILSFSSAA